MISLSKTEIKTKKPVPEWVWISALIFAAFAAPVTAVSAIAYVVDYRVSDQANQIVDHIRSHPEQWTYDNSLTEVHRYQNTKAGIVVTKFYRNDADFAIIQFVEQDKMVEPFQRPPDRRAIYRALEETVGGSSDDVIVSRVMTRLEQ